MVPYLLYIYDEVIHRPKFFCVATIVYASYSVMKVNHLVYLFQKCKRGLLQSNLIVPELNRIEFSQISCLPDFYS